METIEENTMKNKAKQTKKKEINQKINKLNKQKIHRKIEELKERTAHDNAIHICIVCF
jgi:hypothetical protein